ncbi:MAG: hypothetical protein HC874_26150 [Richelia sp. SL_2_1]|nr:hypothetical protein [Richelia sp. SL_2_1]
MPNKTFKAVAPNVSEEQLVEVKVALDAAETKEDVAQVVQKFKTVGYGNICFLLCGYEITEQDGKLCLARPEFTESKKEMDDFEAALAQLMANKNKIEKPKVIVEVQ